MDDPGIEKPRYPFLRTLQHGLQVLDAVAKSPEGALSVRELAAQLELPTRTCYSLLETLLDDQYLIRFVGGRYGLGPKLEELNRLLWDRVKPDPRVLDAFSRLHAQIGQRHRQHVSLNGWYGSEIIIQRLFPDLDGEMIIGPGFQGRLTSRCSTKAILAFVDEERLLRHFASRAHPAGTERTITEFELFRSHLTVVAEQGYALDLVETVPEWCGVAAPFFTVSAFPLGSFGIAVSVETFQREQESLIEAVRSAGVEASQALGYTGAYPPPSPLLRSRRVVSQEGTLVDV